MTQFLNHPPRQGLYDPAMEHDACGVGLVAHICGQRSHTIVQQALQVLENLEHRGAQGSEPNQGDGAGILLQVPDQLFRDDCSRLGLTLPHPSDYGVAMLFLPVDAPSRQECIRVLEDTVRQEGLTVIGWRDVPVREANLGDSARQTQPVIRQLLVGRGHLGGDQDAFERKLYVVRRRVEHALRHHKQEGTASFYCASFSSRTIVYKGMFTSNQVRAFYADLTDSRLESAFAVVHSRFSTNTFPSWERAHPYRFVVHNGEINTLRGNINWMRARESLLESELFGDDLVKLRPILDEDGSDTAIFDNALEFLVHAGRSLPHAAMMMIPEPWSHHETMSATKKAFYQYHSCLMEPWDGPAAMVMTDGKQIAAILDRNGLRPARYYVTRDDRIILASEAGVLDIPPAEVVLKDRLRPGRMLLVDLEEQRIIGDEEIKERVAQEHPYGQWLARHLIHLDDVAEPPSFPQPDHDTILRRQLEFGYTYEELDKVIQPMALEGVERTGSMGVDTPLAVLSTRPQLLYQYFKQLFAQVTNPPIDAIREEVVMGLETTIGSEGNLLHPGPKACHQITLDTPILTNREFYKLVHIDELGYRSRTLPILYPVHSGGAGLEKSLDNLCALADSAIAEGVNILVLSDRGHNRTHAPIPALLAVSALHHHLINVGTRMQVAIVIESGEPREVHHFALLIGYGASAINPYLVFESIDDRITRGIWTGVDFKQATRTYVKAATKGVVKVLSKMGISTIQSYHGAQIFEAIGLSRSVVDRYFAPTASRIEGMGLNEIAEEIFRRHQKAYPKRHAAGLILDEGGQIQWRAEGEDHLYDPKAVYLLQQATRQNSFELFQEFAELSQSWAKRHYHLRSLMDFVWSPTPLPLDQVESATSIVRRFKTGAMSYGSISQEAHEALAIAMNRIGGKSNTGEGGEHPSRFTADANGDFRRSAIKQVASGRFGVTSQYLVNADEIQIKIAQGAKPGEGGQLPGKKVYPWIAEVRHSTPGVGLISPPPHHDIYSIEDLAELIYDLKNANPQARISVKLVSAVGVGTIAAGVAKGKADVVLISGYDGGTGAAPETSIQHTGLPWELGVAETHQTLILNGLRDRIRIETDGKLLTGRDVAIAALLGAEEFGFATGPLISLGCVMMRVCQLDTCPTGIATQNPLLRQRFAGDPAFVVNFMTLVAEDLRRYMAKLGFRTVDEMVGRTDRLKAAPLTNHWKAKHVDLSSLLYVPAAPVAPAHERVGQQHGLNDSMTAQELLQVAEPALSGGHAVKAQFSIHNTDRAVGTLLGHAITQRLGTQTLPDDQIQFEFHGSAGQSFGAFVPQGVTLRLVGDANDYVGKGLSGGKIIVYPDPRSTFAAHENILVGNVVLYGATSGEAYFAGVAGERFAVRNSGALAVVEGVGDHGLEYMTGGRVVVLGHTGRNFAAGMSGGIAYVFDVDGYFERRVNRAMVTIAPLSEATDVQDLRRLIEQHVAYTASRLGQSLLRNWESSLHRFWVVIPNDYQRMRLAIARARDEGLNADDAAMQAFQENQRDLARVTGN
ncbi:MAG: glutamate synthase large subunit [Sulfobacillus acidophilus]|uniref:Glutamate synthase large subunit n=1 Tax=Sulfobacillus acidophilus TaxID=53633 RepID=A0A2T2WM72_9FIRM|nr:MAG: glutamate synthase large subunit [Sulfobacillus acidophilus]